MSEVRLTPLIEPTTTKKTKTTKTTNNGNNNNNNNDNNKNNNKPDETSVAHRHLYHHWQHQLYKPAVILPKCLVP